MKKEFVVERNGRAFVLYAGLLELSHQSGLKSIRTEIIQVPTEANNRVAICMATVVLEKDGVERTFTGIGDAAPNNVAPQMQSCLLRMAETRAKARALRDAVNVGVAAFEELGEFDQIESAAPQPTRQRAAACSAQPVRPAVARGTVPAVAADTEAHGTITERQIEAIRALCKHKGLKPDVLANDNYGVAQIQLLNQAQGCELISQLNRRELKQAAVAA